MLEGDSLIYVSRVSVCLDLLRPITFQGLKCHQCTSGLSLPAVHFLCMHSFHQRCVADSEQECPKCTQQYRQGSWRASHSGSCESVVVQWLSFAVFLSVCVVVLQCAASASR